MTRSRPAADEDLLETLRAVTDEGLDKRAKVLLITDRQAPVGCFGLDSDVLEQEDLLAQQGEGAYSTCLLAAASSDEVRTEAILLRIEEYLAPGGRLVWSLGRSKRVRDHATRLLYRSHFECLQFRRGRAGLLVTAQKTPAAGRSERRSLLSVILPVYNERETFAKVAAELLGLKLDGFDLEIIIVESNSSDGTRDEVMAFEGHPGIRIVLENAPQGKGHAVRNGLAHATGDFVIIQDADLEYDLDDYSKLLAPLRSGETNFVLGTRTRTEGARWGVRHFERQAFVSKAMNLGNAVFLWLFNTVYRCRLADPFTMFKVVRRDCLRGVRLERNRFDLDWELTAKLLRLGYEPLEIPVSYQSRSFAEGKKIRVLRDPLTWVTACFKYRFAPVSTWTIDNAHAKPRECDD